MQLLSFIGENNDNFAEQIETSKQISLMEMGLEIDKRRNESLDEEQIDTLIKEDNWLIDGVINMFMGLVREKLLIDDERNGGLFNVQHTASFKNLPIMDYPVWIQPYNILNKHWVLFAKGFGKHPDKIMCFNSSRGDDSPGQNVITRVALMDPCSDDSIKIEIMECHKQNDGYNCGAFVLAYLTALVFGKNPTELQFDIGKMRGHIKQCLLSETVLLFPSKKIRTNKNWTSKRTVEEEIFCVCRAPHDDKGQVAKHFEELIICELCDKKFHVGCFPEYPQDPKERKKETFFCSSCKS